MEKTIQTLISSVVELVGELRTLNEGELSQKLSDLDVLASQVREAKLKVKNQLIQVQRVKHDSTRKTDAIG